MPTPTSYVYTISTDIPSGLISVARLRREIELSSIVTQIDYVAGGITTPGNDTVTIWFKDPLPTGEKTTFDGSAGAPAAHPTVAGSLLYTHSGVPLPDDAQDVNVTGGSVSVTSGTIDANGKILSPNNVDFLGDAAKPLRVDPTGTTTQPVSVASLPLPASAATEATLSALNTNAADIETILTNIRDTAGIKKITDQLPAGTNNIGDVDVVSSALPAGAATEATVATLATQATAALIKAKTDNLDVALSTRATEATVATLATQATAALIKAKTDNLDVLLSTRATEATVATLATQATAALIKAKTDNIDVLLSTRATESTVAAINTATGATGDADTALTVIGRLKQLLTRLPAALIGGRLDNNIGSWFGSTVPTVGAKTSANSIPVVLATDQQTTFVVVEDYASFTVTAPSVVIGNNKSLLSLMNVAGSGKVLRIREIYIINSQVAPVTGVVATVSLRRITGHSAGTTITPVPNDTIDTLGSITAITGSTVAGEFAAFLQRWFLSTDEWGVGALDTEGLQATFQSHFPIFARRDTEMRPLTLRAGEGFTVKCETNSTAGAFDIIVAFTQQAS